MSRKAPSLRAEQVLEVNEEINVLSVKQHIDALTENIELWLTEGRTQCPN